MRVAIVTQEYPPDTGWGGIGSFSFGLAHALAAEGVDVDVVSTHEDQELGTTHEGRVTVYRSGLPDWGKINGQLNRYLPTTAARLRVARGVRQAVAALPVQPDVIEAPDWMGEALLLRANTVVHLHSPLAVLNRHRHLPFTMDLRSSEVLEWIAVRRARIITAPSYNAVALEPDRDWVPRRRVRLVGMPLDADFLGEHHTPRKEPLVAMIGRLDRLKAPEVLLQSLTILRDEVPGLRAVLVGHANPTESPDGSDYLVWVKQRAADLGLDVELPGRVPRHEVRELCRRARVVAVPSRFETFSMAAAEALACGTPAIVTTRCGIADWLEGAYPGAVIPPDDAVALADALRTPLMDEHEALRRGELGRAMIARRCDPRVIARERISIYRELGIA